MRTREDVERFCASGERIKHTGEHPFSCARTVYRGSQVKVTRISRYPDSICPREGERRRRENKIVVRSWPMSRMKRRRTEESSRKRQRKGKMRRRGHAGVCVAESAFRTLPSLLQTLRALSSSLRSANSYIRRRFRVIGAITHPVFRRED